MTQRPDHDLVARFQAGDREAFRELLERHQRIVQSRLAGRMPDRLRRRTSVADVVQEACLVAYDRREDFEDRGDGAFGRQSTHALAVCGPRSAATFPPSRSAYRGVRRAAWATTRKA